MRRGGRIPSRPRRSDGRAFSGRCLPPCAHGTSDPGEKRLFTARRGRLPAKAVQHTRWGHTLRVPGEAAEGLRPLDPGQVHVPDGVRGLQAVARMDDALAVLAVPGRVRRPHGARRFRIGRGRSVNPTRSWRRAWPSRKGSLVQEQPRRRWRVVKTHSPLRRTEPSARGGAPATAPVARPATGGRAGWPHDVAGTADARLPSRESPGGQSVK